MEIRDDQLEELLSAIEELTQGVLPMIGTETAKKVIDICEHIKLDIKFYNTDQD